MGALLPLLLAGSMVSTSSPSGGDTSVGLLLHDTCAGAQAPVCSRLGRMFMPGFVTRNEQKALRASRAYCELLGTSWECLDARARVLRQRPPDVAAAAQFASGACTSGSARGCVLWAEAVGCGRGVPADVKKGLSEAMAEATAYGNKIANDINEGDRKRIADAGKAKIQKLSKEDVAAWRKAMEPVWKKFEADIGSDLIAAAQKSNS